MPSSRSSPKRMTAQQQFDMSKKVINTVQKESSSVPSTEDIKNIQIMNFTVEQIKYICSNKCKQDSN